MVQFVQVRSLACKANERPPANLIIPWDLTEYPTRIFVLLALSYEGSEHREPKGPSVNLLILLDLTFY